MDVNVAQRGKVGPGPCGQETAQDAMQVIDPCTVVIFGATGDLAKRKLLPAIYNLESRCLLPPQFKVVGVGRKPMTTEEYRDKTGGDLREFGTAPPDRQLWEGFAPRLFYTFGDLDDAGSYQRLQRTLSSLDGNDQAQPGHAFYLAVPPDAVTGIVEQLGEAGLLNEEAGGWRRVIIEKPFGRDLESAKALNRQLGAVLDEHQVYRIDHYLGKETVQNLMVLRFGNGIFEPIWNRRYVDHVQITVAETVGVEDRGAYYEQAGALRDMVQNHMFQLLALTAMEPPISFQADAVRGERVKILDAIHRCSAEEVRMNVVRGQYGEGVNGNTPARAYRDEARVAPGSATETYVALKLFVDNWRWADVPFYLRTGKRLAMRATKIAIQFKRPPLLLFRNTPVECLEPNLLVVRIQPDEGISLRFQAKVPGAQMRLDTVRMDFSYADHFAIAPDTGYETLLYDCMTGDQTLFHRADSVEAGWAAVEPILDVVRSEPAALLHEYAAFTWGPKEADELIGRDGREWRRPGNEYRR
jgi:glucose-6-phosphate 1-dehydrogenase